MLVHTLFALLACSPKPASTSPEGAPSTAPAAPIPAVQTRHATNVGVVAKHRTALNARGWFEVSDLIVDAPPSSDKCYGPCADNPADVVWANGYHEQAMRFADLAELAAEVDAADNAPAADVTQALATLEGLKIVAFQKPNVEEATVRAKIQALADRAATL